MYQSKFLVNRQKILNAVDIAPAIKKYFAHLPEESQDFIYRMEWYRIGISIPVLVYSKEEPQMQMYKECQLFYSGKLENNLVDGAEVKFSIFAVPSNEQKSFTEEELVEWFEGQIKGCAKVTNYEFGPNNCLYLETSAGGIQRQTYTIKGTLAISQKEKLHELRCKALGDCADVGCGLLFIDE
jgi:hypothetical protein